MPLWLVILLQWLHVLCGIFWFGGALFGLSVLAPVLQNLPADVQRVVTSPLAKHADRVVIPIAIATIVLGVFRGVAGGVLSHLGEAYGLTWIAAFVLGVGLLVWAVTMTNPTTRALQQLEPGPAYAAMLKRGITVGLIELAMFFAIFTLMIAMRFGW
jgi:hypothetical protein